MINVNLDGTITEIIFKGDRSIKIVVKGTDGTELYATIINRYMYLIDKVKLGQVFNFKGKINIFRRDLGDKIMIENTFYIEGMEEK